MEALIGEQEVDLVLCCEFDPSIDLAACVSRLVELDLDLPMIVVAAKDTDSAPLIGAMRAGACSRGSSRTRGRP